MAKGINKNLYNIQSTEGKDMSIFADRVQNLQKKEQSTILSIQDESQIFFTKQPDKEIMHQIDCAKANELENFKYFKVYDEVNKDELMPETPVISSRWIIQEKDGGKIKARIVARGYEEGDMDYVDAPTVDKTSIRIILTLCTMKKWKCSSLDVKSAFLQSHKLD